MQVVLQVRVDPKVITKIANGALAIANDKNCDKNFSYNELEWIVTPSIEFLKPITGIRIYGIMIRCYDTDPVKLPENKWWTECSKENNKFSSIY